MSGQFPADRIHVYLATLSKLVASAAESTRQGRIKEVQALVGMIREMSTELETSLND